MTLAQIRELLQSLCLVLHAILIFRITLRLNKHGDLFDLIAMGNHIISEQWENIYNQFQIIDKRLEKLEKKEKENEKCKEKAKKSQEK